ncbi:5-bromo-4-chloroindolyl phosphate hydrolysis family protein [Intestinimonas sp.]|uniref:5-bromo-4-chloroindolyl phosphate hydrolysis family protein n=1 Tax=Intestinimonas sp. TaxID=1965293 RepID=UPI002606AFE2|nr:5-bromo-4-chloroindolyl phosphate hydrolysis family protein [Intestinimonas sp.]
MSDPRYPNHPNQSQNDRGLLSWVPIFIFLFCFPPVGLLLLILRLTGVSGRRRAPVKRHPYDLQREAAQGGVYAGQAAAQPRQSVPPRSGPDRLLGARGSGRGLILGGAAIAAVFGLGAFSAFLDALSYGGFQYYLEDIFFPLAFCGGGLCMTWYGLRKSRRAKRYRQYLSLIGRRDSISVSILAEATGLPPRKIREDLQDMLDDGVFPMGYLDLGSDRLFLSGDGIQDRPAEEPAAPPEPPGEVERAERVLTEIRTLNDAIDDPEMSRKIDRIGEITGKIFSYLREKPEKEDKLRSFLGYYLPTTLKILGSYAQLEAQGVEGANITAAKERIEGMMDKVVEGFEQQLDRLFQDDAMDITSDVAVLERMLEKDGLGSSGMTLGG